ncbi:MAG: magnesium/cobalt transporter CorA [Spirochaetaceae bacterium]|jgi:magnesium transporter|nr:magnesium/cobalt transporter CorA [Spirochaetaceae bacterium]
MELSIIGYDPIGSWTRTAATVGELLNYQNPAGITWINVDGIDNSEAVAQLAEAYRIHPLTVEDILSAEQRPKVEEFDHYLFICLKAITQKDGELIFDHISMVILEATVISFQEFPGDSFNGVRKRIVNNVGKIRRLGTDYLAYLLLDSVVDEYFFVLDSLGGGIETFEERAVDADDGGFMRDIQKTKQQLLQMRRAIWPLRESLSLMLKMDSPLLSGELAPFFTDLQENTVQAAETVETYREMMAGVMEVNLSVLSNRMNNVMKVLTIISTLFIPLTFIVGVYGMNFSNMPELSYPYAYPITWGVMIAIALGMLLFFKRRRWF